MYWVLNKKGRLYAGISVQFTFIINTKFKKKKSEKVTKINTGDFMKKVPSSTFVH